MGDKIEDFKFINWEDYAKTLEKKVKEQRHWLIDALNGDLDLEGLREFLNQAPQEGGE